MFVFWIEQMCGQVPEKDEWLCAEEINRLRTLRMPKRRADWRLGRWAAKMAIAKILGWPPLDPLLAQIEIRSQPSGAPEALVHGLRGLFSLSLTHRDGIAMCAISSPDVRLGCDLEIIEPRHPSFVTDYFTPEEQVWIASRHMLEQPAVITLLWSAKESVLKCLKEGLRLDTRSITISMSEHAADFDGWGSWSARCANQDVFTGWCQFTNQLVRTLVTDRPAQPRRLQINKSGGRNASENAALTNLQLHRCAKNSSPECWLAISNSILTSL